MSDARERGHRNSPCAWPNTPVETTHSTRFSIKALICGNKPQDTISARR